MVDNYDGTDVVDEGVAEEIDDAPSWVKEGTEEDDFSVEGEDVSKAEQMVGGSDVIEPVNDVELVIKSLRWTSTYLMGRLSGRLRVWN